MQLQIHNKLLISNYGTSQNNKINYKGNSFNECTVKYIEKQIKGD